MYITIGNRLFLKDYIVGIFDFDNCTIAKNTQLFLQQCEKNKNITFLSLELPKSFLIYNENGQNHIFVSEYSSKTLLKRMEEKNERHLK